MSNWWKNWKKLYKNGQEISSTETLFILDTADYKEQNIFYNQQLNIYNDLLKQENNVFNAINKNINYNSFDLSRVIIKSCGLPDVAWIEKEVWIG